MVLQQAIRMTMLGIDENFMSVKMGTTYVLPCGTMWLIFFINNDIYRDFSFVIGEKSTHDYG